jgi:hypothetical protein
MDVQGTSAPLAKSVTHRSNRHELRKQRGTGEYMIPGAAFRFEGPEGA